MSEFTDIKVEEQKIEESTNMVPFTLLPQNDPNVKFIIGELNAIANGSFDTENLINIAVQGILVLGRLPQVSGPQKKTILMSGLHYIIQSLPNVTPANKLALELLLQSGVGPAVDACVAFNNGVMKIATASCGWCCAAPQPTR